MRAALALFALTLLAGSRADDPCDCKTLEKGSYCAKCDCLVEKDGIDKDGKHSCKTKVDECKVCVKSYFEADC